MRTKVRLACSFCGKPKEAVRRLIAGPDGVFICNECVALCNDILREEEEGGEKPAPPDAPSAS